MRTEHSFSTNHPPQTTHEPPLSNMSKHTIIPVDKNWTFKQADNEDSKFLPVAQFPTNVHLDLIANGIIQDPFMGKNENDVQWIGETVWIYKTTFSSPAISAEDKASVKAVLAFDGLDTYATVLLNGKEILKTDNMFIPERIDITTHLKDEGENELEITFESAYLKGCAIVEKYPDHHWGCWNGDTSRLAVRKAQYHWGWDWGPTLMTCGPWRPISIELFSSRISDVYFTSNVDKALKTAELVANADVEGKATQVKFDITLNGDLIATKTVVSFEGHATHAFTIEDPALWFPIRYGKQPLYDLTATLLHNDTAISTQNKKFGLRRAELVQDSLTGQPGTSFFFRINNIPIFCGGSNWIPADNFIPRISKEKYRDWVKLVADGNQFMIRVWGGGIFEEQAFYDACDELGILVWQDFMFGCGNYPAFPDFLTSVKREAEENVKLLRHHPSIVIWAGNNEDYQYQESESLTYDFDNKDSESWLKTNFPARYIYEKILVDVCTELIPDTYYHYGSPWGGKTSADPTIGDLHQWNVWHGSQEKYQNFDKLVGRFVSEFGMEAFPNIKTIDAFLPLGKHDPDRFAQSSTVDFHNKADGHERRIALYLVENFRYAPDPLEQFIYSTQLMQAECLASAYRLWKRQWKGPGKEYCGGALVWQINDCWPVTSWAIVDYHLRPKHAYYTVKREMAPISLGITRKEHIIPRDKYTRAHVTKTTKIEIWGSNLGLLDITTDVVVKAFDVITGRETFSKTIASALLLPENRSTEIIAMDVPVREPHVDEESRTVVAAYLIQDGIQIARSINWPEPLKYVHLQKPKHLQAELSKDGKVVEISSEVPVKGVALECEDDNVRFEDNLVDIVPGEMVTVAVEGASEGTDIGVRYLGMV
ncbi:Beta-mannosidase B [Ciborinia camelliae]|nr:Beta-mannosidase B [Ciborinia camelliae]